jgi:hypothetical protein
MNSSSIAKAVAIVCCCATSCVARIWTDNTGKHKIEAELHNVTGSQVVLVNTQGKRVKCPLKRLSAADQAYVRRWKQRQENNGSASRQAEGSQRDDPASALTCRIQNLEFVPDTVHLSAGILTMSKGKSFFPDAEIKIFLFEQGKLAGKTISAKSGADQFGANPHIHASWMEGKRQETGMAMDGYDLELTFGKSTNGQLTGKIDLNSRKLDCTVRGSFTVTAPRDPGQPATATDAPYVTTDIRLVGAREVELAAGYQGFTADGKATSNMVGTSFTIGDRSTYVTSSTYAPRITTLGSDGSKFVCQHVRLQPSNIFVYAKANDYYVVGSWVDVTESTQEQLNLIVDLTKTGDLQLDLSEEAPNVRVIPLGDSVDEVPDEVRERWKRSGLAMNQETKGRNSLLFDGLRPGWYQVLAGKASKTVQVELGGKTKVQL